MFCTKRKFSVTGIQELIVCACDVIKRSTKEPRMVLSSSGLIAFFV